MSPILPPGWEWDERYGARAICSGTGGVIHKDSSDQTATEAWDRWTKHSGITREAHQEMEDGVELLFILSTARCERLELVQDGWEAEGPTGVTERFPTPLEAARNTCPEAPEFLDEGN